jgi:hypothetical protein
MATYNNIKELCEGEDNFWKFGRSLYKYTDCGPWCRLVLKNGENIYYESKEANDENTLNRDDIVGLEIGSIVEGSDVEVGPYLLKFPFTDVELGDLVEELNNESDLIY